MQLEEPWIARALLGYSELGINICMKGRSRRLFYIIYLFY
jgi:hypothetical protein